MTRRLTPAEQLAAVARDATLQQIADDTTTWNLNVVKRAVIAHGRALGEISANDVRDILPELGRGYVGTAFRALACSGVLQHTGRYVPSTAPATHGHKIAVYRLGAGTEAAA